MTTRNCVRTAALGALLAVCGAAVAARDWCAAKKNRDLRMSLRTTIKELASRDRETRERAYKQVHGIADDSSAVLTNIVRGQAPPYERRDAIDLAAAAVAEFHDRATIAALVESIECPAGGMRVFLRRPHGAHPCVQALILVGQSSVPEILRYLAGRNPDRITDNAVVLYAAVLKSVYAEYDDEAEAERVVERAIARSRVFGAANLERLLNEIKEPAEPRL